MEDVWKTSPEQNAAWETAVLAIEEYIAAIAKDWELGDKFPESRARSGAEYVADHANVAVEDVMAPFYRERLQRLKGN